MPKGGARPGSGTKPGPKYQRVTGALPGGTAIPQSEPLKPAVEATVKLLARGFSYREIARRRGLSRNTVNRWSLKYRSEVSAEIDRLIDPSAFVEPLMPATYDAIEDSLQAPADPTVRLNAAKLTMAYRFGAPAQRVESRSLNVHRVIIEDMRAGSDVLGAIEVVAVPTPRLSSSTTDSE